MGVSDRAGKPFQKGNDPRRNPDGKWKKGCQTPNPAGRATLKAEFKRRLQEACEGGDGGKALVDELITIARDTTNKRQLQAIELSLAYAYGRPTQHVEAEVKGITLEALLNGKPS